MWNTHTMEYYAAIKRSTYKYYNMNELGKYAE